MFAVGAEPAIVYVCAIISSSESRSRLEPRQRGLNKGASCSVTQQYRCQTPRAPSRDRTTRRERNRAARTILHSQSYQRGERGRLFGARSMQRLPTTAETCADL